MIVTPRMTLDLWSEDDAELPHRKVWWFQACKDPSSSFPDRTPPRPNRATFILDTLRKARWLRTQLPAHHFHGRFHGLMQAGSLDTTYVQDRTHKRRDYIGDFRCYAPGSPYPVDAHNRAGTHLKIAVTLDYARVRFPFTGRLCWFVLHDPRTSILVPFSQQQKRGRHWFLSSRNTRALAGPQSGLRSYSNTAAFPRGGRPIPADASGQLCLTGGASTQT